MATTVLFFYGSLKRGHENNFLLAGQEFIGEASTAPRYRIVLIGQWAGLIRDDDNGVAVRGELWSVDAQCLARLDEFEMSEGAWRRAPVAIEGRRAVESYLYTGIMPSDAPSSDVWPFG